METKIKINGQSWLVKILSKREMKKEAENDEPCRGLTDTIDKMIFIREDCVNYQTIAHELFHCFVSDLCLNSAKDIGLDSLEEIFAEHFEAKGELMVSKAKRLTKKLQQLLKEQDT